MKIKTLIFCIAFFSVVQGQIQLSVQLSADKTTYYVSEPIFVNLKFYNRTGKPVPIYYVSFEHLIIKDDRGRVYHSNFNIWGTTHTIAPGDSFVSDIELLSDYCSLNLKRETDIFGFPAGTYTVLLKFRNEDVQTSSNTLTFQIIEPVGAEKEALKLYSKMRYMGSYPRKFNYQETIKVGLILVEKYPKSVYAPSALMLANVKEEAHSSSLRFFEQLVKNYPNDKVASSSVLHHFLVIENYNLEQKSILNPTFPPIMRIGYGLVEILNIHTIDFIITSY